MEGIASLLRNGIRRAPFGSLSENLAEGAIVFNSEVSNSARPIRLIVVGWLLLISAIIATTAVLVINLHDRTIAEAGRELRNLALVLGEQTNRSLQSIELAETNIIDRLRLVHATDVEDFRRIASSSVADATLKSIANNSPQLYELMLIDAYGSAINSSRVLPLVDSEVADQDYFRTLKADPTLTSFISAPTYVRSAKRWTIHIARQVRNGDGQLLGLLLAAVNLHYFEELYQRVSLNADSTVALIGNDGLLLARYPRAGERIGKSLANNPMFGELIASANFGSVRLTSQVDGKDRIILAHRLDNHPIVLTVGTTVEAALSNWRSSSLYAVAAAVLLIVFSGGITIVSARQIATKLRTHNLRLNTALNNMGQGLVMFDGTGHLVICNQRYLQMYDLPPERVRCCRTLRDILHLRVERGMYPGDPDQAASTLVHTLGQAKSGQHTTNLKDGRSIKVTNEPMPGGGWVSTHDDITELRRARTFLDTIIENVPVPIIVKTVTDQRCTLINHAAEKFFAVSREQMIGKVAHEIYTKERADIIVERDSDALRSQSPVLFSEHSVPGPQGEIRRVKSTKVVVGGEDGSPQFLISLLEDVTEKSENERRIAHMAHHDVLTDLPNRAFFNERLAATIANADVAKEHFAIICIDLDGFGEVNDLYGHAVGDALLRQFSHRVNALMEGAFLARLGGDEFTFIVIDDEHRSASTELSRCLLAAVSNDFEIDGYRLQIGLSMGIAIYPSHGSDAKSLMNNADAALYRAKGEGRGSIRFFEPEMGNRLRERRSLQEDLKFAVERGELFLNFQPQAKITGETIGFEALVRWTCPKRGAVLPSEFIPVAEESGVIIPLGEWVLREACREAASWPIGLQIAVNISPVQFRSGDLPNLVHAILMETGLTASRLELEITEGVLIDDFSRAVSLLRRLKSLGVKIALDDFGTGYSSLSYLHSFPFDKIKIDRTFIANVQQSRHSTAIVRAVIGLGRSLDIPILAEGVETEAERSYLRDEGCDEIQGYLTGRPYPIEHYADRTGRPSNGKIPEASRSAASL